MKLIRNTDVLWWVRSNAYLSQGDLLCPIQTLIIYVMFYPNFQDCFLFKLWEVKYYFTKVLQLEETYFYEEKCK